MEQKRIFDRRNKGGRPKKGAADKLKYRLTVKMATSDYYTLKGKARNAGVSAGEFLRSCMRDGQVKERLPQPACAQGECGWFRYRENGMPCVGRTYRGSAKSYPFIMVGYDS